MKSASPAKQLADFIAKFAPEIARLARAVYGKLRKRHPGAVIMVYDNYQALAIGFGARDRPSEAVLSVAVMPRKVAICFIWGKGLPDPHRLLRGSGNQVRTIRIEDPAQLDDPRVAELLDHAIARSATPFDTEGRGKLIIKSISAKQRPRRLVHSPRRR
jgi:hypothetical protein